MAVSTVDLLSHLLKTKDSYTRHRKDNFDSKFVENLRLYQSYRDNKANTWETNIFLSYAFSMIETILPREITYLWQGDRFVKAHPRERTDIPDADVVDDLIQYQIDTDIEDLFMEFMDLIKTHNIQGTGIGKLTQNVLEDKPEFVNIDIFDFYPQPYKKYIDKMDGMFHVYDMPVDVLMDRQNSGVGYQGVEQIVSTSMGTKEEEAQSTKDAEVGKIRNFQPDRKTALIYQYWGKIPVQERIEVGAGGSYTRYREGFVEIANRKFIIRQGDNPYKTKFNPDGIRPFIVAKDYTDPYGDFWGIGEIQPIKDIQYEANELECGKVDNLKLIMNQMWLVGTNAGVDLDTLVSSPGNVVIADDTSQVKNMPAKELPASISQQQERYEQLIQMINGVSDYSRGTNAPGMSDTVGGITSLIEEANMRFAHKIKCLQMTTIKSFATKLFMLNKIFIKGIELPVRLQNEAGYRWSMVRPDNLKGMYDFKPVSIAMIGNKLAKQNTRIRLLEVLAKAPPLPSLIKGILSEFEVTNIDEIMDEMHRLWGVPPPGQASPMAGTQGETFPGRPASPSGENLGRAVGAGMR